jgi:hypothetical protein
LSDSGDDRVRLVLKQHQMNDKNSDLEIEISRESDSTYSVELRFLAARSDTETCILKDKTAPLQKADLDALNDLHPGSNEYAETLTQLLFADPMLAVAFERALTSSKTLNVPLRIRVLLDSNIKELHTVCWEALRDFSGKPLFTSENVFFSRYIQSLDGAVRECPAGQKLKALIVIANPANLASFTSTGESLFPVESKIELENVKASLAAFELSVLEMPTIQSIATRLRDGFDVLYLVCHGAVVEGEAQLLLCDEAGNVDVVAGEQLANRIRDLKSPPRLVVMASCQSAQGLESIGPKLGNAGVPAILAMNGNISIETNSLFMPQFFSALTETGVIDQAVSVARGAVRDRADAWMPILYMRLRSGQLLPRVVETTPQPPPSAPPVPPSPGLLRRYWIHMAGAAFLALIYLVFFTGLIPEDTHMLFYSKLQDKMASGQEGIGILVDSPMAGHFYAFAAIEGEIEVLYPRTGKSSALGVGTQVRLPADGEMYEAPFDHHVITIIWSPFPLDSLEEAIKKGNSGAHGTQVISGDVQINALKTEIARLIAGSVTENISTPSTRTKVTKAGEAVGTTFKLNTL